MTIDYSTILTGFSSSYWYFIPVFILIALSKTPWFKGVFGEFQVNLAAKLFLNQDVYHLIKNVTLPTDDGTTQIDHIIVSRFGIFVIETKNMKGWIFGGEKQRTWTQKIYKHTNQFKNPLHQNYKHTRTLQSCLNIPEDRLFSVVVFVGDSTFKTDMPDNVTFAGGYVRYIKSKKEVLLSDGEVADTVKRIESGRLTPSMKTNREHVNHIKTVVEDKKNRCPKCGSELVVRVAMKGANADKEFLGCSGFPKCHYAVVLDNLLRSII